MMGKVTPREKVEEILRMNDNGCLVSKIAKKTGVIESTVRRLIHNGGKLNRRDDRVVTFNPQLSIQENMDLNGYKSIRGYRIALNRNKINYNEQYNNLIKIKVIELYNSGKSMQWIQHTLKLGYSKVKEILESENIDTHRNKIIASNKVSISMRKDESEEMEKEIIRLTIKGFSGDDIREILNKKVSYPFVYKIRKKYGYGRSFITRKIKEKWEDRFNYMKPKEICKEIGEEYTYEKSNLISYIKTKNLQKKKINSFPE